jgi:hypothetical protein
MGFPEIAADEYASALVRLGVVGDQLEPPLALKAKSLELAAQLAHAGGETFRRGGDGDAAVLVALHEAGFFKIG